MTLSEGEVAALAREAVDRLDPAIDITIEPADPVDPYHRESRAWLVWPLLDGHRSFGVYLDSGMTPAQARERLVAEIARNNPAES
jgi:hypothetical protein